MARADGGRAATSARRPTRPSGGPVRTPAAGISGAAATDPTATVVAVRPTGMRISRDPVVEVELRVFHRGEAWRVAQRDRVPADAAERLAPGTVVRVTVDPGDRERVRVDWSSAA